MNSSFTIGANWLEGQASFRVWAPFKEKVVLHLLTPEDRLIPMEKTDDGYHTVITADADAESRYRYIIDDDRERPDPASRFQPEGVHGPSAVFAHDFAWTDQAWAGLPLTQYVIYELHVGTFTEAGTFDAVIPHLDSLKDLGITAIELMPVNQFPGVRNWGYDGVYPFAVQGSYGGPAGMKRLVNACHERGMAVILDVVYNHFGPEGNYLWDYGPYFTDTYQTPWGYAINFDGAHCDGVRQYFTANALYFLRDLHIDALRLDAIHAIYDFSAHPFLEELARDVQDESERLNRSMYLIAESALNDTRVIRPREVGGFALDAQWNDDFHHALHCLLTGESSGYYRDYGSVTDLVRAFRDGYVYTGQYSAFRQRRFGNASRNVPARQLVVFAQNHDQTGNRMMGERLSALVSLEKQKLAAGVMLLSPFIPLLFMGEEYGETAPFPYFISHTDTTLVEAVRQGRRNEFAAFEWKEEPPDPQSESTFISARLNHPLREEGDHRMLWTLHRKLLRARREIPALARLSKKRLWVRGSEQQRLVILRRWDGPDAVWIMFNFNDAAFSGEIDFPAGTWTRWIDSSDNRWHGPGATTPEQVASDGRTHIDLQPHSFALWRNAADADGPQ